MDLKCHGKVAAYLQNYIPDISYLARLNPHNSVWINNNALPKEV